MEERVSLGSLRVSRVCLGTMTFGTMSTEQTARAILDEYVELGGNFVDSAEMYPVPTDPKLTGESERILGRYLKTRPGLREKLVIATKVAGPGYGGASAQVHTARERDLGGDTSIAPLKNDLSDAQIRRAVDASLARLQIDTIDLYQIHWPERAIPLWGESQYTPRMEECNVRLHADGCAFERIARTMGALIAEGKVREWGLSNETSFGVCRFHDVCSRLGVPPPVSIQNDFSLCYRQFESELAEACSPAHCNVRLLVYGALNGGALTGKYLDVGAPSAADASARFNRFPTFQPRYKAVRSAAATREYVALARASNVSPAALAQAWCYSRHYVGCVIIGATSLEQLRENFVARHVQLDEDIFRQIDEIHVRHRNPNLAD